MKKTEGWVTAPQGFLAAGVKAGIKASGNHDVAVIFSTVPAACAGRLAGNAMQAASAATSSLFYIFPLCLFPMWFLLMLILPVFIYAFSCFASLKSMTF